MNEHTDTLAPDADMLRRLGIERGPRRLFTRRRLWIAGAALVLLLPVLYFALGEDGAQQFVAAEAVRGPLRVTVTATGTLQPEDQVDVGAEISGQIDSVLVDFNDRVRQGQILAQINTEQLRARLAQSDASLASARANISQNEATLVQTRSRAERSEELFARNVLAMQDLEAARADLRRAEANLARARADVSLAEAQVAADRTALSKAAIRSPIDGIVLNRLVEPGQAVAASFQTPVLFTLASDLSRMELLVDIDEADIGAVREGQAATFTVDAFPQRRFSATLVSVRNAPRTSNGVVTYQGVLLVDNSSGLLRPGLTANAEIVAAEIGNALLVPNGALRFTPDIAAAGEIPPLPQPANGELVGRAWVLEGGRPVPRDLVIGLSDGRSTQVLSGELAEGESVVTDVRAADAAAP